MPDIETRVRRLAQEYLTQFVNTPTMLREEDERGKTYMHMLERISERYRDTHKPSGLEWNMGEARAVKEFVVQIVGEIRRGT
jgi:hypothetical protein